MLLRNEQAMTAMLERRFKYACIYNLVELTNKFVAREDVVNYVCPTSSTHKRTNFLRHHRKDFSFKFFFLKPNITSQNSVFIQNAGIILIKYKMLLIFREILWVPIMK